MTFGVEVIRWLQQASPALDTPFRMVTALGSGTAMLILLPLVYWCIGRSTGARLALLVLASAWLNAAAKLAAAQPRPFEVDSDVRRLTETGTHGFPSGHAQVTVVFWGYLAARLRKPWLWLLAAVLMVLVPLSRLYLGVHFPIDLLGGYLLGAALLLLFVYLEPAVTRRLVNLSTALQLAIVAAITLPAVVLMRGDPYGLSTAAALAGTATGLVLERRYLGFGVAGSLGTRLLRLLLGLAVLFALHLGLRHVFADLEPAGPYRVLRYFTVGLWLAFGAPWLFMRSGLAAPEVPRSVAVATGTA